MSNQRSELIIWTQKWSVGDSILDKQHKKILGIINQLIDNADKEFDSEFIGDLLSDLTVYARRHFSAEEHILEKSNYPDLAQHKLEHESYRLEVANACLGIMQGNRLVPTELIEFLKTWWTKHVLESDMQYKQHLETESQSWV